MKCPKCHYLSFDPEPRCKNCGFSLALDEEDLTMHASELEAESKMVDLALRSERHEAPLVEPVEPPMRAEAEAPSPVTPRPPRRVAGKIGLPKVETPSGVPAPVTTELPLFVTGTPDAEAPTAPLQELRIEEAPAAIPAGLPVVSPVKERAVAPAPGIEESPLPVAAERVVNPPVPPGVPIARTHPVTSARKAPDSASFKLGPLDSDLLDDLKRFETAERRQAAAAEVPEDSAGVGQRLGAAAFDALFVGGMSAGMLWLTLRWCDLSWAEWAVLPMAPTVAFLLIVCVGYLLMFTAAGGQTIGKMLFGIRVVAAGESGRGHDALSVRQALYRELVALPSVLALGAGFVPALVGQGRAVHDRMAETRVVRA